MEQDKNDLPLTPIKCPICGSINIAFTEEYHKTYILKIISDILLIAIIIDIIYNFTAITTKDESFSYQTLIILSIFYILFKAAVFATESKTHTKGICRDCGHIWIIS